MKIRKFTAIALALAMLMSMVPAMGAGAESSAADVTDGLVLHYTFDNDSSSPSAIADSSGNGFDGTVLNTERTGGGGPWGGAAVSNKLTIEGGMAKFPGSSATMNPRGETYNAGAAIKIPEAVKNKIDGDYTVSLWAKADSTYYYNSKLQRLFDFGVATNDSIFVRYNNSSGDLRFQDRALGNSADDANSLISVTDFSFTDKWALLTVTYSAGTDTVNVYVNGTVVMSSVGKFSRSIGDIGELTNAAYGMFLGRTQWNDADNPDFCGYMDDVRIYDRTLTNEDVLSLYSSTYHSPNMKMIVSGTEIRLTTATGEAPVLPQTANVTFSDGTTGTADVEWDRVDPSIYAYEGKYSVFGTVTYDGDCYGKIMTATVTVSDGGSNLEEGLVVYYSFDNDDSAPSVINDDSGNGFDATAYNNGQWMPNYERKITVENGTAYFPGRLDSRRGGAYIKIPEDARSGIQDYTVSMWVKADSTYKYNTALQRFFDFGISTTDSIFVRYNNSTGDLRFQDRALGSSADDTKSFVSATNTGFNDAWALLTVVYTKEDAAVSVYVNGQKVMSDNKFTRSIGDIGTLTDSNAGMLIGRTQWNDASNPDFCGWMDEIRLYDRAVTEDEIELLYKTTNPEPMVNVEVTYALEDGTVIYSEIVSAAEKSRYTYNAPETYEYEGTVYNLSYSLSTLTIDGVNSSANKVKAVYVVKGVSDIQTFDIETYKGTVPALPETAEITYNTGEYEILPVEWEAYDRTKLEKTGSFTVTGKAGSNEVTVTITVFEITDVETGHMIYTSIGEYPLLPETVNVKFSNKDDWQPLAVEWEEIPADKLAQAGEFTVTGVDAEYNSGTAVEYTVAVILEAVTESIAEADTYTSTESIGTNYGGETSLKISSQNGGSSAAGNTRYAFLRFKNEGADALKALLKIYIQYIDNNAATTFYVQPVDYQWPEYTLNWSNQTEIVGSAGEVIAQTTVYPNAARYYVEDYLEFDISDYVAANPDLEYYSFMVTCSTCAVYANSRETGENPPVISYTAEGRNAAVNYVYNGETVYSEDIIAAKGDYAYLNYRTYVAGSGGVYVSEEGSYVLASEESTLIIPVNPAQSYEFEEISVKGYVGEEILPESIKCVVNGNETYFDVSFDVKSYDEPGIYYPSGYVGDYQVTAEVKAYEPYRNKSGKIIGYAGIIRNRFVDADGKKIADTVNSAAAVGSIYTADSEVLGYYPQIKNAYQLTEPFEITEPVHEAEITGELIDGISGAADVSISGDDASDYLLTVSARAANTGDEAGNAKVIIVKYDSEGTVIDVDLETAQLPGNMTGREDFAVSAAYDRESGEDIRIYFWDGMSLRPLADVVSASDIEVPRFSEEVYALIPEYDDVAENVTRANAYRQSVWGPNDWVNGIDPSFWDTAAYHTGNMEAYFTFGDEAYKQYSIDWANGNKWMGNNNTGNPDSWTWGYNQSQGSNAVLFGDWQICFQSYLDLYLLDPENSDISRVEDVMGYQITKENDDFWWWADALYMVPPVMTKLYLVTGNEGYLDALYKYYSFAAELMYDGECGIPTSDEGYTTDAKNYKYSGSNYSDPDDYKHLFFRDGSYVYPLNPNPGHTDEKNFWARGNGWVFAGLAKILEDVPSDYEHYGFFLTIYEQMAEAIISCQKVDSDGNGFWTQSMLQNYPIGNNGNDEGYETSGTAFMTYGLFWGLNSGILDEKTYLEPALRGWKYLSEVALLDDGRVGYCQPIGSNATQATAKETTQPFGFGAFLLAGCEVSRWVGGVSENNAPYLQRKLWSAVAFNGDKYYAGGEVISGSASFTENDTLYVPLAEVASIMGFDAERTEDGYKISNVSRDTIILGANVIERNGTDFVAASTLAKALGKQISTYGDVTVISHKTNVFYDCDENAVKYLNELLAE